MPLPPSRVYHARGFKGSRVATSAIRKEEPQPLSSTETTGKQLLRLQVIFCKPLALFFSAQCNEPWHTFSCLCILSSVTIATEVFDVIWNLSTPLALTHNFSSVCVDYRDSRLYHRCERMAFIWVGRHLCKVCGSRCVLIVRVGIDTSSISIQRQSLINHPSRWLPSRFKYKQRHHDRESRPHEAIVYPY